MSSFLGKFLFQKKYFPESEYLKQIVRNIRNI
jgi:hypothetical protein